MRESILGRRRFGRLVAEVAALLAVAAIGASTASAIGGYGTDSVGAVKVDATHIRDADGTLTTCGPGLHVVKQDNGKGGTAYLCEP